MMGRLPPFPCVEEVNVCEDECLSPSVSTEEESDAGACCQTGWNLPSSPPDCYTELDTCNFAACFHYFSKCILGFDTETTIQTDEGK